MNAEQVAAVVAKIRIGDNRETSPEVILEWLDTIGDLNFDDAIEAVRMHRRESTEYLAAAHLRANVKRLQAARNPSNDTTPAKWREIAEAGNGAPKPANWDALSAAWDDPQAWAREIAVYDAQLSAAGFAPVGVRTHSTWREAA
jgi:hypothetical protein